MSNTEIVLDLERAGAAFPPIHEGRYEVDPWATKLRAGALPACLFAKACTALSEMRCAPHPSTHAFSSGYRAFSLR